MAAAEKAAAEAKAAPHESLLAGYTGAYSPATHPLTPPYYSLLLHSILSSNSPAGNPLPPSLSPPHTHLHAFYCAILYSIDTGNQTLIRVA